MAPSTVSAVLFAKDQQRVTAFYRDALGLVSSSGDRDHSVLLCGSFELVVHQIPGNESGHVTETAVQRREHAAIRLEFQVDNIAAARAKARSLGGRIDDAPPAWAPRHANYYLGHDPEGNVFKLSPR